MINLHLGFKSTGNALGILHLFVLGSPIATIDHDAFTAKLSSHNVAIIRHLMGVNARQATAATATASATAAVAVNKTIGETKFLSILRSSAW